MQKSENQLARESRTLLRTFSTKVSTHPSAKPAIRIVRLYSGSYTQKLTSKLRRCTIQKYDARYDDIH